MVKKSLLWVYRIMAWLLGITVIVLLISAIAIQFLVLPNINEYKDEIAAYASESAKQKIVIGHIKTGWQGFNPHLTLSNIDIYDSQNRPALQLKNTEVALSWLSIPMFEPHLAELIIRAPELTIRRIASGEIFVAGMSMNGESKPDLPNWLLRQTKVAVIDAKIVWLDEMLSTSEMLTTSETTIKPPLSLNKLNLEIVSPPWKSLIKNHQISVSALPSVGTNNPISITGNVYGNDISKTAEWRGNLTLILKNANIVAFKPWLGEITATLPVQLQSGVISTKTIVHFGNRQAKSVDSEVALNQLKIQIKDQLEPIVFNTLSGKFNWKNLAAHSGAIHLTSTGELGAAGNGSTGNAFNVSDLSVTSNHGFNLQDASATYIDTTGKNKARNQTLKLTLTHINLASLKPLLVQLPLPANALGYLNGLSPTGTLDDLALSWEGNSSTTKSYQLSTKFNGLGIKSYEKIPGFDNLTGVIKANQNVGKVSLTTQNAKLDFKGILRWPIPADKLAGDIHWNIANQANKIQKTYIAVTDVSLSSPHLSGSVNGSYTIESKGDVIDLTAKFNRGDAKYAPFYYPIILGESTIHWLDTSILAGQAEDINLVVKGRVADFPFVDSKNNLDTKLGLFRVTAKVSNSVLEYGIGWPLIEGLGLNLLFEGKRMELNATKGHIFGNDIVKSKTTIAQLDADDPILTVTSEVKGPVAEGIKFVNKSPVVELTQGFTNDLKTSGLGHLNLSLKIPLNDIERAQYKGAYAITNGTMQSEDIPALTGINGLLEFTESSLSAKNIKANAFGAPLAFNLASGKDKVIRVAARGKLTDDALKQIFSSQNIGKATAYINGNTDWFGDITIQKPRINVSIRSDLMGISSSLPAPFTKAVSERLNLLVDKKQDDATDTTTITLGNKLAARISRTMENGQFEISRASIRVNADSANNVINNANELSTNSEAVKLKGLQIYGNLDYLDADAWRNVMTEVSGSPKPNVSVQDSSLPIQKIALKINTLDIFDRRLNQLKISNKSDKDGLRANIQSREISGDLQWLNQNNGKLIAHLTNFMIPEASPNRAIKSVDTNANNAIKLNQIYPALDITADSFEFNKKKLGALTLVAFPQEDNWSIQKFKLTNPESTLNADGIWNKWVRNPNTRFNLNWDIKDLGKTLARFGYADTIKGGSGELNGQLNWAGSPHEFDTLALNGNLQFDVRKGEILKVQPGVGRLLGLLSLQSLPRRLSLDFRDLFSNGFAFDKINATVKIDRGVMRSDNFSMTGPAADVTIKGETNLQKETQQLFVKVMPHISDSISLAALAGGPLVGAVAFLAQKILKDPLNKIASSEYEIAGTWDNPYEVKTGNNNEEQNKTSPLN